MADGRKPGDAHASQQNQSGSGHVIEKSAVEARQGFSSRRIFYVLIASLALVIIAYAIIAGFVPR
jgi:hypothetical protein